MFNFIIVYYLRKQNKFIRICKFKIKGSINLGLCPVIQEYCSMRPSRVLKTVQVRNESGAKLRNEERNISTEKVLRGNRR